MTHRLLAVILLAGLVLRLFYTTLEPGGQRFVDDRYSIDNVRSILATGTLAPAWLGRYFYPSPVFNLPPAILIAAGNALHAVSGDRRFLALDEEGKVHEAGVVLYRLPMVAYGTLSIWLLFLVGRRLFAAEVGLIAAAMQAFMPWMIHSSVAFKPDALLVLTTLVAFYASLRAFEARRLLPYLLAGVAIALAMSSKLTGGVVALPLAAATALAWREGRRWFLLAAAGLSSVVAFLLLNPYWRGYAAGLASLRREYEEHAIWDQMTHAQIPGRVLGLVFAEETHGPVIGALALGGLVALAVVAGKRGAAPGERTRLVMMLVFPLGYVAAYMLQTPRFKFFNFLPIIPFTAMAAAWLLARIWRRAARRLPLLATRSGNAVAAGVLALLLVPPGINWVYDSLVPSTEDYVRRLLHNRVFPPAGRSVVIEAAARRGSYWQHRKDHRLAEISVDRLDDMPPVELDLADAEVFAERHLSGSAAGFYRSRIERLSPSRVKVFRPRFLELRGPALVALVHQHSLVDSVLEMPLAVCDSAPTCVTAALPSDMVAGERISLEVWIHNWLVPLSEALPPIRLGERSVELIQIDRDRSGRLATTARVVISDPATTTIRFEAARRGDRPVGITLYRWADGPLKTPLRESKRRRGPSAPG